MAGYFSLWVLQAWIIQGEVPDLFQHPEADDEKYYQTASGTQSQTEVVFQVTVRDSGSRTTG